MGTTSASAKAITETSYNDVLPSEQPMESRGPLSVVVVSDEPVIRNDISKQLTGKSLSIVLVSGLEELKIVFQNENVVACLCGFKLADGSFRDVVSFAKRRRVEVPVIMVSAPASASEYRDFLKSLNAGAYDFICFPYRMSEVQRILWSAIQFNRALERMQSWQECEAKSPKSNFEPELVWSRDQGNNAGRDLAITGVAFRKVSGTLG